ncbi:MAG: preprotein translocase subunit SecG [Synergistaceae bacterium]|jgi:preprotein translocase subunit SecG|nr:preprotein translocase subunit SecG [Synergistaceae bacterium]
MKPVFSIIFLALCVGLAAIILLQHRKSGGFSGNFGGGGTQMDMAGGSWQRMTSLTKITVALTAAFMAVSFILVKL